MRLRSVNCWVCFRNCAWVSSKIPRRTQACVRAPGFSRVLSVKADLPTRTFLDPFGLPLFFDMSVLLSERNRNFRSKRSICQAEFGINPRIIFLSFLSGVLSVLFGMAKVWLFFCFFSLLFCIETSQVHRGTNCSYQTEIEKEYGGELWRYPRDWEQRDW